MFFKVNQTKVSKTAGGYFINVERYETDADKEPMEVDIIKVTDLEDDTINGVLTALVAREKSKDLARPSLDKDFKTVI